MDKMFQIAYIGKKANGDRAVDSKKREITGWASKPLIDRDDELIEWDAWELDNFNKNPVLMPFHDYGKTPIGRVMWTDMTEEGLLFGAKFADEGTSALADEIFALYDQGIMNAFSVGFKPMQWVDAKAEGEPKKRYTQAELLEISAVGLPSLTEALVAAYESGDIHEESLQYEIKTGAITKGLIQLETEQKSETVTKPETTESYHRIPVRQCNITSTIDISAEEGIKALYCGDEKQIATYLFDKAKWTMAKAREWVKEHDGGKGVTEEQSGWLIPPEFKDAMEQALESEIAAFDAWLVHMGVEPDDFRQLAIKYCEPLEKEGRVLSGKTRKVIMTARDALNELLEATEMETDDIDEENVLTKVLDDMLEELPDKSPEFTIEEILQAAAEMKAEKQGPEEKALEMLALELEAAKGEFV